MKKIKLGDSELELLRFVARNPQCQVREACDYFQATKSWARTTVLKTLDRLREKELIDRKEVEGTFRYRSTLSESEIEETLVHQFLNQSMEGSVKSLVSYLHTYPNLNAADLEELKKLVQDLESKEK